MNNHGYFIVSLDFELHWGTFDAFTLEAYRENLENVPLVINRILKLAEKYHVNLTFATVGMLFFSNKADLLSGLPKIKPDYTNKKLNAFQLLPILGESEELDPIHFAKSSIETIKKYPNHEIASHTFSHYYCKELGQDTNSFVSDLAAFKILSHQEDINLKSIVFPKNQINDEYLLKCQEHGYNSYRGSENNFIYESKPEGETSKWIRALRFLDAYINLTGHHVYKSEKLEKPGIINIPSSRFLRPYNSKLSWLERYKIKRIKRSLNKAAKTNAIFHLWWHPHNFGSDMDRNFDNLETIFKEYSRLNKEYDFQSLTMDEMSKVIKRI